MKSVCYSKAITKIQAIVIAVIVVIAAVGAGIAYYYSTVPKGPNVILIGASMCLSGYMAGQGQTAKLAYEWAIESVNNEGGIYIKESGGKVPVKLIMYDDKTDPTAEVSNIERLVTVDKVDFLLGSWASNMIAAGAAAAEKHKIPYVAAGAGLLTINKQGYQYVFIPYASTSDIVAALFKSFNDLVDPSLRKTIAIWQEDTSLGSEMADATNMYAGQYGWKIVFSEKYTVGSKDFTPMILKTKGANPDVVIAIPVDSDGITLIRQSKELDFAPKAFYFPRAAGSVDFSTALGKDADYVMNECNWQYSFATPGTKELADRYFKEVGKIAPSGLGQAYVPAQVLLDAIKRAGTLDKEKVRDALAKTDMITVMGRVTFDMKEYVGRAFIVPATGQWQPGGKWEVIWPAGYSTGKLMYPAIPWKQR